MLEPIEVTVPEDDPDPCEIDSSSIECGGSGDPGSGGLGPSTGSQQCGSGDLWDEATQSCIDSDDVAELGCPQSYNGYWSFVWNGHTFYVLGRVERTRVIRSWPWGEAEYRLPPGPVTSTDNQAVYWSGIGLMKCYGYLNTSGQFIGALNLTWKTGDIREL